MTEAVLLDEPNRGNESSYAATFCLSRWSSGLCFWFEKVSEQQWGDQIGPRATSPYRPRTPRC